jgi:hypothetical protein
MKKLLVPLTFFAFFLATVDSYASSEDECAIWICIPGGFPSGCGSAKSAMKDRIKDRKSPLPSFSSCAVNPPSGSGSHMSSKYGYAARIGAHTVCEEWGTRGRGDDERYCIESRSVAAHYRKGVRCRTNKDGGPIPKHCTGTFHWAEVFVEGELTGPTYYFQ